MSGMVAHLVFVTLCFLLASALGQQASPCQFVPPHPHRREGVNANPRNMVFFTDGTNFDDVIALLYIAKSPRVNLLAIYIQGNAWASPGSSIMHFYNLLHMMSDRFRDVPIYIGAHYALVDEIEAQEAGLLTPRVTYRDSIPFGNGGLLHSDTLHGMGHTVPRSPNYYDIRNTPDTDLRSISALYGLLDKLPKNAMVEFLTLGTFSSISKMFSPQLVKDTRLSLLPRLKRIVAMGGAVFVPGNLFTKPENDKAEYNIYADPHSAQWAFTNLTSAGVKIILVPLDATNDVPIARRLLRVLLTKPRTPEAQLSGIMMRNLRDTWFDPAFFFDSAFLWDPSAAIVATRLDVVKKKERVDVRVVIEEGVGGPRQGWTKPCDEDEKGAGLCSKITVILDLDAKLVTDALLKTLQQPKNSAQRALECPA